MKAFRGQPSVFASTQSVDRRAELEVKKVYLNFGGVMALHDVDLTVHTGELVSVIGPNGAGKTSLMNCITGYYHPQKGQILFNGGYGPVRTDHVLFIGAGAFHVSKPSDLIPELQGRFPIRVELGSLGKDDFVRILTEPDNALIRQYEALMATEGVRVSFTPDAVDEIADVAEKVNAEAENIGARRLHTVVEKVMEDIAFAAPDIAEKSLRIDREYVRDHLKDILVNQDLCRFIL